MRDPDGLDDGNIVDVAGFRPLMSTATSRRSAAVVRTPASRSPPARRPTSAHLHRRSTASILRTRASCRRPQARQDHFEKILISRAWVEGAADRRSNSPASTRSVAWSCELPGGRRGTLTRRGRSEHGTTLISGIAFTRDEAKLTVLGVPDKPASPTRSSALYRSTSTSPHDHQNVGSMTARPTSRYRPAR